MIMYQERRDMIRIYIVKRVQEEGEYVFNDKKGAMGYEMNVHGNPVDSFEGGELIGESEMGFLLCHGLYGEEIGR
ncbi:hypothetical protein Tco_0154292 [Tanacetum coccineum]